MTSEIEKPNQPVEIYFEDAVRFFKMVTNPGSCPMCSTISWSIPVLEKGRPISLVISGLQNNGLPQLELKVSCNKCGFYRGHNASLIQQWLLDNPVVKGDKSE